MRFEKKKKLSHDVKCLFFLEFDSSRVPVFMLFYIFSDVYKSYNNCLLQLFCICNKLKFDKFAITTILIGIRNTSFSTDFMVWRYISQRRYIRNKTRSHKSNSLQYITFLRKTTNREGILGLFIALDGGSCV